MSITKKLLICFSILLLIGLGIFYGIGIYNGRNPNINFAPQKPQLFVVGGENNNLLNIVATTLPQFAVSLKNTQFSNLWKAYAKDRDTLVNTEIVGDTSDAALPVDTTFNDTKKQLVVTPLNTNQIKAGLYHLHITIKTVEGKDITITQDFTWGVLAINTSKTIYQPGETVKIGMGVLDDRGHTKCIAQGDIAYATAKVWLTILSPSGKEETLSTDTGTIIGSKECAPISVTNNPDFQATYQPQEIGKYTIHMKAQNINGTRSVDDFFTVSQTVPPFTIMRTSYPTRIYPLGYYPVEVTIIANKNYSGNVTDIVPSNFIIQDISDNGTIKQNQNYQEINWHVDWSQGKTYTLHYGIKFPPISPEFYLIGPLTIGNFSEGNEWQIASDAISQAQTLQTNIVSSTATSLTAIFANTLTANNMEFIICATGTTGSGVSISTPTTHSGENSWSTAFSSNSNSGVKVRSWYRVAKATDSKTFQCNFGSTTGTKTIQIFEYSGLSTSTIRDVQKTHTSASCSGGTFTSNGSTFIPGNPIVLVIASFTATNKVTVSGFTAGYTKETEFTGASVGTFSTHDQVTASITDYTDTITYLSSGGTCAAGIVSFNSPISISQGGYQFFANINNVNPTTTIGSVNTPISLSPRQAFRLRLLLDIDGTQSLAVGAGDFILQYATLSAGLTCNTASYDPVSIPGNQTDIAFNPQGLGSGVNIASSGSDPADGGYTTRLQSYYEDDSTSAGPTGGSNPGDITNDQLSLAGNQAGLWDFSLRDNTDDTQSNTYCIRVANPDGSDLSAYVRYPQVTTFYNEVNIKGGTIIKGPGSTSGSTIIK